MVIHAYGFLGTEPGYFNILPRKIMEIEVRG